MIGQYNFIFMQMSKLLCNVLKISGGKCPKCPPPGCAPDESWRHANL